MSDLKAAQICAAMQVCASDSTTRQDLSCVHDALQQQQQQYLSSSFAATATTTRRQSLWLFKLLAVSSECSYVPTRLHAFQRLARSLAGVM